MTVDYEPRLMVKDGRELVCGSIKEEVRLKYAGWQPKETHPASGPASLPDSLPDTAAPGPAKRSRVKTDPAE